MWEQAPQPTTTILLSDPPPAFFVHGDAVYVRHSAAALQRLLEAVTGHEDECHRLGFLRTCTDLRGIGARLRRAFYALQDRG
jgi:hypothetical protein